MTHNHRALCAQPEGPLRTTCSVRPLWIPGVIQQIKPSSSLQSEGIPGTGMGKQSFAAAVLSASAPQIFTGIITAPALPSASAAVATLLRSRPA